MQLLKCLQTFIVVTKSFVHKTKVIDSFNTISFDSDGFKEEFLCSVIIFIDKETVTLVYKCLRVVPVMLNRKVSELLSTLEVVLQEVKE